MDPHPGRLSALHRQPAHRLVLPHRARARPERPQHRLSARPRAGRQLVDQRHDLHARPSARFCALAGTGQYRLGLGRCAALLQALGRLRARRGRDAQQRRRMARRAAAFVVGDPRRVPRRGRRGRHSESRRLQPRQQRGLRLFRGQPETRRALECHQGLPAPGTASPQSEGGHRRAGAAFALRRQARHRGGVLAGRATVPGRCQCSRRCWPRAR